MFRFLETRSKNGATDPTWPHIIVPATNRISLSSDCDVAVLSPSVWWSDSGRWANVFSDSAVVLGGPAVVLPTPKP